MRFWPVPPRTRGREILDDPETPDHIRQRAMQDVARSNALFGGTRAVLRELNEISTDLPAQATLLDVGTGLGDIPAAAWRRAAARGVELSAVGMDVSESLLAAAKDRLQGAVAGDARRLPFANDAFDVVICSQVLHHFFDDDLKSLLTELHRVSRDWVIVSDLRRSWVAVGGFWLASSALRFHEVTRIDGMTSVLRGFEASELSQLVTRATGATPRVHSGIFWRLTATWRKNSALAAPTPS